MLHSLGAVDPDGLLEFSVVFTDRSMNHMSQNFQDVMNDISASLKLVYKASAVTVIPGGGSFAMEAVARQFAEDKKCLILRNGWFSYRWTQIFEAAKLPAEEIVLKAAQSKDTTQAPFAPSPIEEVVAAITREKPAVVFAPHVETSSGIILPDDYVTRVGEAVRAVGGLFVLDCIASGAIWVDMAALNVDVLISAPQKGWSATPCAGLVMLNERAVQLVDNSVSSSFACDLRKWLNIMRAYENGGHAYHATMPTDGLIVFRDRIAETRDFGLEAAREAQVALGREIRTLLKSRGFPSVAAQGYEAPGVVVSYTDDPDIKNGSKFAKIGMQIAGGVPLQCDEREDFQTFRMGLFGLDKLKKREKAVAAVTKALDSILD